MSGSVVGTSDLPLELKGDPSCSEPDPDSLNLSSPPMNAPDLALSTPPAERVRAWAQSCHSSSLEPRSARGDRVSFVLSLIGPLILRHRPSSAPPAV